jgi:hypothetical protein
MSEQKIEEFWRDATAGDAENGKGCVARFRDHEKGKWFEGQKLTGWRRKIEDQSLVFYDGAGVPWRQCQVYDPQQWWLDRPDPGKGWRLLKKFPDEPKLATDEAWDCHLREWRRTATTDETQSACVWYRRRVESNISEKLDSCVDHLEVGKEYKLPSGQSIFVTEKGFEVF